MIRNERMREKLKEIDVRVCEKFALTVDEAAAYFGIGEKKLRSMISEYHDAGYFMFIGVKTLIKRRKFEDFLNGASAI